MAESKPLILCADDFASDRAVSDGILRLAAQRRLSAVSSLVDAPLWTRLGPQLTRFADQVLLGLHFNLTMPLGFGEQRLWRRIAGALLGRLDERGLRRSLERQIDRFAAVTGRCPDYIDGHEHVHTFPIIRDIVFETAATLRRQHDVRIRDLSRPVGPTDAPFKRSVIRSLALVGARRAGWSDLALNTAFAGDYSLSPKARFPELFTGWLASSPAGGLMMCHPRLVPAVGARTAADNEFEFLDSDQFWDVLGHHRCRLVHAMSDIPARPATAQVASTATGQPSV
jgi:predicted glycoside hydrolase/deacetylase ChbG (UPF0249 family)